MATSPEKTLITGTLYKRQRGRKQSNSDSTQRLSWQRRRIRLTRKELEYYGKTNPIQSEPNGTFPLDRIKIVSEIPDSTFQKKYCFQIGDEAEVIYFRAKNEQKRRKWIQAFYRAAVENGNTLLECYHTGAFGIRTKAKWSCCDDTQRDAKGCKKKGSYNYPQLSATLPSHTSGVVPINNDMVVFSEEENDESDEDEMDKWTNSAPTPITTDFEDNPFFENQYAQRLKPSSYYYQEEYIPGMSLPLTMPTTQLSKFQDVSSSRDSGVSDLGSQVNLSSSVRQRELRFPHALSKATSATYQTRSKDVRHIDTKECQTEISIEIVPSYVNAVQADDIALLQALMTEERVNPNMNVCVSNHRKTILCLACESGHEQIVDTLITNYNADVNLSDESGCTPLMIAAKKGLLSIARRLMDKGAKVNLQSNDGRTALHEAAEGGHLEIVNSLLQNGANPFMFAGEYTPLDLASKVVHNRPVVEALKEKLPIDVIPYTPIKSIQLQSKLRSLKFKCYGEILALSESTISLISVDIGEEVKVLVIPAGSVTSFDTVQDTLVLGSESVQFIDMQNWEWKHNYEPITTQSTGAAPELTLVAMTPRGKLVSSTMNSACLSLWKPSSSNDHIQLFHNDYLRIAARVQHQVIKLTNQRESHIPSVKVCSLNISKNQNAPYIAVGVITHDSECQVHIYNYDEEAEQLPSPVIKLGKSENRSVIALSPNGSQLASGMDQKLEIFSVTDGALLYRYSNGLGVFISSLAYPPDGTLNHLSVGLSTGQIKVFRRDLKGRPLFTLENAEGHKIENPAVTALAYSKDAQFLAAGHQNGLLQLWRSPIGSRQHHKLPSLKMRKFVVGEEGGQWSSDTRNYSFAIPRGVLDSDMTITHGVIPFGQVSLQFPENIIPVSIIVSACPDQEHLIPFEISLKHCLSLDLSNPENLNSIVLLKANVHRNGSLENDEKDKHFKFKVVKDAKIRPREDLLSANVAHFCAFCFGTYITEKDTNDAVHFYLIEIKPKVIKWSTWNIEYCLSYVFDTCKSGFERYHPESEYTLTRYDVEFSPARDGKEHCVELFVDEVEKSGWKISILGSKQITKESLYFWNYPKQDLLALQQSKRFPPRITLTIDSNRAENDVSFLLNFEGITAYPGREKLCVNLQLECPTVQSAAGATDISLPSSTSFSCSNVYQGQNAVHMHLKVLRQHHAKLVAIIDSKDTFNSLLANIFAAEVIDEKTYDKFLSKQENNPNCQLAVLSGQLLLDIRRHLEKTASVDVVISFCKCIEKIDSDCAAKLLLDCTKDDQLPAEEVHSEEVGTNVTNERYPLTDENDSGLQSTVKHFKT